MYKQIFPLVYIVLRIHKPTPIPSLVTKHNGKLMCHIGDIQITRGDALNYLNVSGWLIALAIR